MAETKEIECPLCGGTGRLPEAGPIIPGPVATSDRGSARYATGRTE
jgi:hypothetical protein